MGEQFEALIDVTIFYPDGAPTFFQFLEGRMKRVVVKIRELPIQPELIGGDYQTIRSTRSECVHGSTSSGARRTRCSIH